MTEMTFGEKLRKYREDHYLTQRQMAELLGVSNNHIGVLEHNRKKPRPSTEAAFARLIGKDSAKIFHERYPMNDEELAAYTGLWRALSALPAERRGQVIAAFAKILDWVGAEKSE